MNINPISTPVAPAVGAAPAELGMIKVGRTMVDLFRNEAYGRRDGYRTLDSAISAVSQLTRGGNRQGVAITVGDGGRFFAHSLTAAVADARFATGMRTGTLHLTRSDQPRLVPLHMHNDLRAIVDGNVVVRA